MLQQIRDRTTGLIAGFIVALIAIPFAFFGIESFRSDGGDPVVAKVGGQKIYESQFKRAFDQRYQQLVSLMGENFRADMLDQNRLRKSVLDEMTRETMLKQFTASEGYQVDDATIFTALTSDPAFQKDGKFDPETYRNVLASAGYTPDRYEKQLRDSLQVNQMRDALVETTFVTDVQVDQALRLDNEERTVQYALFETARYRDRVTVSQDEIQQRYDETRESYQAPERIKLDYIELSPSSVGDTSAPGDDVLKVLYDAEKDSRFKTREERKASHILITFGADKSAAREKIDAIAKQLADGADFATLAQQDSEDPGSKASGGDLGWVARGQMVDAFEQALFSLQAGQVSEPVETEFGWHLIKLDEVKPSITRSFDDPEVKKELTELFVNRERQQRFQEMSEKLEQLAFENPASLGPVSEALGLKVQTSDWFTRDGGTGIAANEAVKTAAFSTEVLDDGENSKPLALGDNRVAVIRKAEYEPPRQKALEEVADQVRDQLINERARGMAAQDADEVINAVKSGTAFQEIVSAKNGELRNPGSIRRDDKQVESVIVAETFKMPRPADGETRYAQAALGNGSHAVIALSAVTTPAVPTSGDARQTRSGRLRDVLAGGEFMSYLDVIERNVGIELTGKLGEVQPVQAP
jgi:peptidyl-prolyl cis-trans isomerase D